MRGAILICLLALSGCGASEQNARTEMAADDFETIQKLKGELAQANLRFQTCKRRWQMRADSDDSFFIVAQSIRRDIIRSGTADMEGEMKEMEDGIQESRRQLKQDDQANDKYKCFE